MITEEKAQRYRAAEDRLWGYYNAKPKEHFLDLAQPGLKLRVLEIGDGEPVVFIHGGPNAGSTWAPIAQAMQDYRCIILDRPGCGLSEAADYSQIDDFRIFAIDVLTSVLDTLAIEQAAIVASSFGSAWALWFAEAHPERVSRIAHEGCPPFLEGAKPSMFMRLMMIKPLGRMIARQTVTEASQEMNFRQLGHKNLIGSKGFSPAHVDWGLSLMNDTDTMKNEIAIIQRGSTWFGFRSGLTHHPGFLKRLPQPMLFLWGENDPFGSVDVGLRACEVLPNATLRSFPDSGHLPWLDDPQTHIRLIRDFLVTNTAPHPDIKEELVAA
ncbi:MAG TPA: alpha/beta hydrolase [Anaerolineales bacterium]|nr:alpha/beta hydrolase [Anaerolineales bacterium]